MYVVMYNGAVMSVRTITEEFSVSAVTVGLRKAYCLSLYISYLG